MASVWLAIGLDVEEKEATVLGMQPGTYEQVRENMIRRIRMNPVRIFELFEFADGLAVKVRDWMLSSGVTQEDVGPLLGSIGAAMKMMREKD